MFSTPIRTLLVAGAVSVAATALPLTTAVAQATKPNACALIDGAEVIKLTGRKDVSGKGPQLAEGQSLLPPNVSQCDFVGFNFAMTTSVTAESFAQTRKTHEARPNRWKVETVSGLGDEAYYMWDPRPGSFRSVGIAFRSGSVQVALGDQTTADSVEAMKKMLLPVAKHVASKVK